ncbi:adhesion G protein-coupled receptor A1 isoform X2 [Heterocephalus glaber]|uniref:Adhesion G protein-coupled receptor A1 isoform X2 n=1 Tax=Heterocephalus glaber TaxID=10181 RepID=A0AAX6SK84_HETGA|nr:adhesion G protein-coupled receptor A1 isoform X2 [Heterocephalus glaber]
MCVSAGPGSGSEGGQPAYCLLFCSRVLCRSQHSIPVTSPCIWLKVGIVLHYSTLSTMLWIGVTARNIYKQVTKKALPCPGADQPPFPKKPLLRFYLISGGIPFIICGVTAATNISNYGTEDEDTAYCWMAWEPSLGAFYGPAAFIALVTCVYFLSTYVQLRRHPERRYELRERTEEQQRLAVPEGSHCHGVRPGTPTACDTLVASQLQNEHSFKAQLRAAAFTLFLFTATWTFGALAVSQGHFLDMIFSCLYGAFCVTLGLFVLIHHCAKREDVWQCWWSCCPSRGDTSTTKPSTHPALDANGDILGHTCLQDSPGPGNPRGFSHAPTGHCKMTNLQAAQGHVSCLSPATPCCAKMHCEQLMEEEAHVHMPEEDAFPHDPHLHRCLKGRTKPHYFSRHQAAATEHEYAYHIPSSLDGSPHSSHTDSPTSSLEGPMGVHTLACCTQGDPFPMVSQPEGSDASPALYGCPPRLPPGPAHLEMLRRTQSLPFGGPSQNGMLKGTVQEGLSFSTDGTGNIRTGPWKNETTV